VNIGLDIKVQAFQEMRRRLTGEYPELEHDEDCLLDTLEGETDLFKAIELVFESARMDELMADAIGTRIDELKARQGRLSVRVERKRQLIADAMEAVGVKKIERPTVTLSLRNGSPSVLILDEGLIPDAFKKVKTVWSLDKTAIKNALLGDGQEVPGATLSNGSSTLSARIK